MRRSMGPLAVVLLVAALGGALAAQRGGPLAAQRAAPLPAQRGGPLAPPVARRTPPRLVVILVVDQFRADYVARFSHQWTAGLRRILDEGASFPQAAYPFLATVTCVGHSTIATGTLPRTHGIVGNSLWDRSAGRAANCVADPVTTIVSYGAPVKGTATSTRRLLVPTLADEFRAQLSTAPRIVTLSLKDYTATMMAGRKADAAVWFSASAGTLLTSSAFTAAPAPWVTEFLKAHPIEGDAGKRWAKLLPQDAYLFGDDAEGEGTVGRWTRTFPHVLDGAGDPPGRNFYDEWAESPFSDRFLGSLAERAIDALELGQRAGTDYLAVSFTALDLVGHDYGPRSHEVQDTLAHLDRTLGSLLAHLDRRVGRDHYVLALTGDHGVSPVPEQMAALGLAGGRIPTPELTARIEKALEPLGPGKKVARMLYGDVFFAPGVTEKLRANPEAMRAAVDAARTMPGIARVFTAEELAASSALPGDEIAAAAARSFLVGRSGDLVVVPLPYHQFASSGASGTGTGHGSPYWYDRRVPLVLLGKGIKAGNYAAPASPADIAPTLAFLCGITLPAADGRVLNEALGGQ